MLKTSNFECVKIAIKQDKSGYVLTLSIHPDDISEDILRDFVGARYQAVFVRLNDDQTAFPRQAKKAPEKESQPPAAAAEPDEGTRMVTKAGVLGRSPQFWDWLASLGEVIAKNEADAAEAMHRILGVHSRSELATNTQAQVQFGIMLAEYESWKLTTDQPPF